MAWVGSRDKSAIERARARAVRPGFLAYAASVIVLMGGEIHHVARDVRAAVAERLGIRRTDGDDFMEAGNPWGSMPSDAIPAAASTARSLAQLSPAAGAVAWTGTGLLAFTVIYRGEHYVTDVIVGLALREAVWRAEPAIVPLVHLGLDVLHELERRLS